MIKLPLIILMQKNHLVVCTLYCAVRCSAVLNSNSGFEVRVCKVPQCDYDYGAKLVDWNTNEWWNDGMMHRWCWMHSIWIKCVCAFVYACYFVKRRTNIIDYSSGNQQTNNLLFFVRRRRFCWLAFLRFT